MSITASPAPFFMSLPPELISRILGHLGDDFQSLKALSLVSKAWTSWCQARLFEFVHLTPSNIQRWLKDDPKGADGPASYTRTLALHEYRLVPWINPQHLGLPSSSNLVSFSNVKSLSFIQWNATLFNASSPGPYFGHFGKSLRTLSLQFCTFEPVVLFDLLSVLPNVEDLEITHLSPFSAPYTTPDVPEVSPSFRGTLSLAGSNSKHSIIGALAALPLRFSTIRMNDCTFYEPDTYQTLLTSCRDTLVTLRFEKSYRGASRVCPGLLWPALTPPNL
jgi:hypothetical protein